MLQRTALALAFSRRKPWIIADEPTSALDAENRLRVLQATANYIKQEQTGVLWITHHEQETLPFADRVFIHRMNRRRSFQVEHTIGLVLQNAALAFNPRLSIRDCLQEPLSMRHRATYDCVLENTVFWSEKRTN